MRIGCPRKLFQILLICMQSAVAVLLHYQSRLNIAFLKEDQQKKCTVHLHGTKWYFSLTGSLAINTAATTKV